MYNENSPLEEEKKDTQKPKFVSFTEQQADGTYKETYGYVEYDENNESTIDERVDELRSIFRR